MNRKKRKDRKNVSGVVGVENGMKAGIERRLPPHATVRFDPDRYRRHVDHFDLTETQKTDLLHAVWRIMQSFVDRAFGDDPVQQVRKNAIGLQPSGESPDDGKDLSDAFSRHAADRDER